MQIQIWPMPAPKCCLQQPFQRMQVSRRSHTLSNRVPAGFQHGRERQFWERARSG
jgi:hypothetical protein